MKCPRCQSPTHVQQVRAGTGRRRRICLNQACRHTFHTQEVEVEPHQHGDWSRIHKSKETA